MDPLTYKITVGPHSACFTKIPAGVEVKIKGAVATDVDSNDDAVGMYVLKPKDAKLPATDDTTAGDSKWAYLNKGDAAVKAKDSTGMQIGFKNAHDSASKTLTLTLTMPKTPTPAATQKAENMLDSAFVAIPLMLVWVLLEGVITQVAAMLLH